MASKWLEAISLSEQDASLESVSRRFALDRGITYPEAMMIAGAARKEASDRLRHPTVVKVCAAHKLPLFHKQLSDL